MSNAQKAASGVRWVLLSLAALCWLAGLFWLADQIWPQWKAFGDDAPIGLQGVCGMFFNQEPPYVIAVALYLAVFLTTQWFFLSPRGSWRIKLNESGRPMKLSIVAAALMAALLTFGVLAALAQLAGWWPGISDSNVNGDRPVAWPRWPIVLVLGACWIVWAAIFFVYWRKGTHATQLGRMLRGLFAGSILETIVATPVHVLALRNENDRDCYCQSGSYTALVFGGTVLLWTFGPGLVLLFLREKERREPLLTKGAG
ncbi:MAG TPA: hypothetical protein VL992_18560 [Tepidisphaeraceae bacterium]|nr:hypothetical protein [Tepidisphaeraceae bacterium]